MFACRSAVTAVLIFACSNAAALAVEATTPAATTAPIRHLEYSFTIGVRSDTTTHDSGIHSPGEAGDPSGPAVSISGINELRAGTSDSGTISVDVLSIGADSGVVLSVSEHARERRNAEPAQCVVYGNSYFVCDTSKNITQEEIELVRLLGRQFTNAVPLDANKHWQFRQTAPQFEESSDFTIESSDKGVATINLQRVTKMGGSGAANTATEGKIVYDRGRSAPLSIALQTITHSDQSGGTTNRSETQIAIKLLSDSKAP